MCRRHAIFGELDDELKLWRFVDKFPTPIYDVTSCHKGAPPFLVDSYLHARYPAVYPKGPPIGKGIGLAFGLFLMQQGASVAHNYGIAQTMTVGLLIRLSARYSASLCDFPDGHAEHSTGKITTMLSTDTTRLDFALGFCHSLWISPLMIILALGLLIGNLGYSALVSVGVLLLGFPAQGIVVKFLFNARKDGIVITDSRVRLLQEETLYGHKVDILRRDELKSPNYISATFDLISLTSFIPILAAILAFITYSLTGHPLDPAIIFSSLQMLNCCAWSALVTQCRRSRLTAYWRIPHSRGTITGLSHRLVYKFAVDITDGSFIWKSPTQLKPKASRARQKGGAEEKGRCKGKRREEETEQEEQESRATGQKDQSSGEPSPSGTIINEPKEGKEIFKLKNINMHIAKGQFIGIVGKVGSGKSSLLNALIGEMRKTNGSVSFNGTIAYTPQNPWLANATVRDNILFEIHTMKRGEQTEIGEKGINLSGGQKARVSLARVAYSKADVVFLTTRSLPWTHMSARVSSKIVSLEVPRWTYTHRYPCALGLAQSGLHLRSG
ncbi:SubName: Full=Probable ATP-binding cassette transporter protein YOR1 {ECO:0000313/EMBL:CCA75566.1} [Serendipita indica DSM 11827]|nr:SubName: Full=Probable ATP-binding cassette transporter protein YOR1 {ECO:0000313/EMBL:CCA75566.1} [Serendipita indica DSM 11827]